MLLINNRICGTLLKIREIYMTYMLKNFKHISHVSKAQLFDFASII
jgi:hypothetical protein